MAAIPMEDPLVKALSEPEKVYTFLDGSTRGIVRLQTKFVGLGHYLPGWRWSEHVKPMSDAYTDRHVAYVLSGGFVIQSADGDKRTVNAGAAFEVAPNHDAWVLGDEPCIALDFGEL